MTIAERVARVRERIQRACEQAGRDPDSVLLVAIAKNHPPEAVRAAAECGIRVIGENRVQEAAAKIPLCPGHLDWHMVGHLQSNKVRPALRLFSTIHSVDSADLLRRIARLAADEGVRPRVLLEVNVSGERSKFGLAPEQVPEVITAAQDLPAIELVGLMTMPPFFEQPEKVRPFFAALRELRDRCVRDLKVALPELSMGMSHDFEYAILEGATMIRVGTDIFGPRPPPKKPAMEESP